MAGSPGARKHRRCLTTSPGRRPAAGVVDPLRDKGRARTIPEDTVRRPSSPDTNPPMTDLDINLMRGTLELLILKALTWGPRHGYAVAEWIGQATDAALLVGEGTLYPALHRLERQRLVEAEWGVSENNRSAKFYRLSAAGRRRLVVGSSSWHRFVEQAGRALRATSPAPA